MERGIMHGVIEAVFTDLRYTLRAMLRSPVASLAVISSLALGIGANVAVFSVIDSLMLKPLPVSNPSQLVCVHIGNSMPGKGFSNEDMVSFPVYLDLRNDRSVFEGLLAASSVRRVAVEFGGSEGTGESEQANLALVSGNYFATLGAAPFLGRVFTQEDDSGTSGAVAVITYGLWRRRFGLDASVLGRTFRLGQVSFTIMGVTRPGFTGMTVGDPAEIFVPLSTEPAVSGSDSSRLSDPNLYWLKLMARLKPGTPIQLASSNLGVAYVAALAAERVQLGIKAGGGSGGSAPPVVLSPGARGWSNLRRTLPGFLYALMGLVGVVFFIACCNIANITFSRAVARKRELMVRIAIGAGRRRLVCQFLVESLTASIIGGAAGLLLALWGSKALLLALPSARGPILLDTQPDLRIAGFTLALSLLTGVVFGLAPAWRLTKTGSAGRLVDNVTGLPASRQFVGKALLIGQIALSLVLLAAASLFTRNLAKLRSVDLGFRPEGLYQLSWDTPAGYSGERLASLFEQATDEVRGMPGVLSASVSASGLFSNSFSGPVRVEELPAQQPQQQRGDLCKLDWVGRDFFATVGIPITRGRAFEKPDGLNSPLVVVVNQSFVRNYFGNIDPIGKRIYMRLGSNIPSEIVGVAKDASHLSVREATGPKVYALYLQDLKRLANINCLEVQGEAATAALGQVVGKLHSVDPNLSIESVSAVSDLVDQSLSRETAAAELSDFFGVLAALLCLVGLYGTMSYSVSLRSAEIGIRMALGARPGAVQRMILGEAVLLLGLGVAMGLPAAIGANRLLSVLLSDILFRLSPSDPTATGTALGLISGVAMLAAMIPARRAARLDPLAALRHD
jgi:predicted permease